MTCFPDINVWIALTVAGHEHHEAATEWYAGAEWDTLVVSRITQMGFLRLLTNKHVMKKQVANSEGAWAIVDELRRNPAIRFALEPPGIETVWRKLTAGMDHSPNAWTDAWLAAFAIRTGYTLVTFDQGLQRFAPAPLQILDVAG